MGSTRRFLEALAAAALLGISAPGASADEPTTLRVDRPIQRDCAEQMLPAGSPGAAGRTFTAPASGILTARLQGDGQPDWDLAMFRGGTPVAASTAFGSIERASTWVDAGDSVLVQACRRDGRRAEVPLSLDLYGMELPKPSADRISLESVPISSPDEIEVLEQLGFDVTEDRSATDVTVALYGSAQRALLSSAGFSSTR